MKQRRRVITRSGSTGRLQSLLGGCRVAGTYVGGYIAGMAVLNAFGMPHQSSAFVTGLVTAAGFNMWAAKKRQDQGPRPALLRALERISREMDGMTDPGQLSSLVVTSLARSLKPEPMYMWLPYPEMNSFYLAAGVGPHPGSEELPEHWVHDFFDYLSNDVLNPVDLPADGSKFTQWLTDNRLCLCLPIISKGALIGLLTIGEKADGKPYTASDRWLLNQTLRHAAMALSYMGMQTMERRTRSDMDNLVYLYKDAQRRAVTDGLTGLATQVYFREQLKQRFSEARRHKAPMSVMFVDVDHFKKFNDTYGHQAGDEVLKRVAEVVKQCARVSDTVARYGGEELALVLPQTDLEGAYALAERIRRSIEAQVVKDNRGRKLPTVTASIGVAEMVLQDATPEVLLERADEALYSAKHNGRNQVVQAG